MPLATLLPRWPYDPRSSRETLFELDSAQFAFIHHPNPTRHAKPLDGAGSNDLSEYPGSKQQDAKYLLPTDEYRQLCSIVQNSEGGSVLVTGYRGVGKTSFVNRAVHALVKSDPNRIPLFLRLSTTRTATSLCVMLIRELWEKRDALRDLRRKHPVALPGGQAETISNELSFRLDQAYERTKSLREFQANASSQARASAGLGPRMFKAEIGGSLGSAESEKASLLPYQLEEMQHDIDFVLRRAWSLGCHVLFILDEIDKLTPTTRRESSDLPMHTMEEIQQLVADLKFLLTETRAHFIFIAGKDVDDSWQQDQNKGEGLFESIFLQNVYLPSFFSARFDLGAELATEEVQRQCCLKKKDLADALGVDPARLPGRISGELEPLSRILDLVFRGRDPEKIDWILRQPAVHQLLLEHSLGLARGVWTHNTGRLVLPYLASAELFCLLPWSAFEELGISPPFDTNLKGLKDIGNSPDRRRAPRSQSDRRDLRDLLRYLTFKGRGIPRKILREFYSAIAVSSESREPHRAGSHLLRFTRDLREKVSFFAAAVRPLEYSAATFDTIADKGRVASFHVLDFILKFYESSFTWADLENAAFMTEKDEIYPGKELLSNIVKLLEGNLIEVSYPDPRRYRILPTIRSELRELHRRFGPEELELKFTEADFRLELARLLELDGSISKTSPDQRLEVVQIHLRLGETWAWMNRYAEAHRALGKARRLIRAEIDTLTDRAKNGKGEVVDSFSVASLERFIELDVSALLHMGRIAEQTRELDAAKGFYEESVQIREWYWRFLGEWRAKVYAATNGVRPSEAPPIEVLDGPTSSKQDRGEARSAFHASEREIKLFQEMCAESPKALTPFSTAQSHPGGWRTPDAFRSPDFATSLNRLGICLERMGRREAANRFLVIAYDYHRARGGALQCILQASFIGDLCVRRRDLRLAARWYRLALERLHASDEARSPRAPHTSPGLDRRFQGSLYERLGDVLFASRGEALGPDEVASCLATQPPRLTWLSTARADSEPATTLYNIASGYYMEAQRHAMALDVELKKLWIDAEQFLRAAEANATPEQKLVELWKRFWRQAGTTVGMSVRGVKLQRVDLVEGDVDLVRVGEVMRLIGYTIDAIETRGLWSRVQDLPSADADRVTSTLLAWPTDPRSLPSAMKSAERSSDRHTEIRAAQLLLGPVRIGARSLLSALRDQRQLKNPSGEALPKKRDLYEPSDCNFGLASVLTRFIDSVKTDRATTASGVESSDDKRGAHRTERAAEIARRLEWAEVFLLGSYQVRKDRIRGLEVASSSYTLGKLYLSTIAMLTSWRDSDNLDEKHRKEMCKALEWLHVSSKRFLANANSIYTALDESRRREQRVYISSCHAALGDLMLLRADHLRYLSETRSHSEGAQEDGASKAGLLGSKNVHAHPGGAAHRDHQVETARADAERHYREALHEYWQERSDYEERYPINEELVYASGDFDDSRVHSEICRSVRFRYPSPEASAAPDEIPADGVTEGKIARVLRQPPLRSTGLWDSAVFHRRCHDLIEAVATIQKRRPLVAIKEVGGELRVVPLAGLDASNHLSGPEPPSLPLTNQPSTFFARVSASPPSGDA